MKLLPVHWFNVKCNSVQSKSKCRIHHNIAQYFANLLKCLGENFSWQVTRRYDEFATSACSPRAPLIRQQPYLKYHETSFEMDGLWLRPQHQQWIGDSHVSRKKCENYLLTSKSIPVTSGAKWHPQDALPQRREVRCASCLACWELESMSPINHSKKSMFKNSTSAKVAGNLLLTPNSLPWLEPRTIPKQIATRKGHRAQN